MKYEHECYVNEFLWAYLVFTAPYCLKKYFTPLDLLFSLQTRGVYKRKYETGVSLYEAFLPLHSVVFWGSIDHVIKSVYTRKNMTKTFAVSTNLVWLFCNICIGEKKIEKTVLFQYTF